jgi:hypothetical protein
VTLYEVFSLGKLPFPLLNNEEVMAKIETGYRLPKPELCPTKLYNMMLQMWSMAAKERPSFNEIFEGISSLCAVRATSIEIRQTDEEGKQLYHNI